MKRTDILQMAGMSTGLAKDEVKSVRKFSVTGTEKTENNIQFKVDLGDGVERRMWVKTLANGADKVAIKTRAKNAFPWDVTLDDAYELWVNRDGYLAIGDVTVAEEAPAYLSW